MRQFFSRSVGIVETTQREENNALLTTTMLSLGATALSGTMPCSWLKTPTAYLGSPHIYEYIYMYIYTHIQGMMLLWYPSGYPGSGN